MRGWPIWTVIVSLGTSIAVKKRFASSWSACRFCIVMVHFFKSNSCFNSKISKTEGRTTGWKVTRSVLSVTTSILRPLLKHPSMRLKWMWAVISLPFKWIVAICFSGSSAHVLAKMRQLFHKSSPKHKCNYRLVKTRESVPTRYNSIFHLWRLDSLGHKVTMVLLN